MSIELWRDVLDLNLTSVLVCCREVLAGMKEQGWGRIINISSISGRSGGGPGGSHYAAAKAAVNSLTKSLAKEGGEYGITANAVSPGVIFTEIHQKHTPPETLEQLRKNTLLKRIGQPEDIAGAVAFLASNDAGYITGEHLAVNGGLRLD
jgi:NAD(P)-dependent dehydrogenase (short-subunit alcohol dehydrogenase family)